MPGKCEPTCRVVTPADGANPSLLLSEALAGIAPLQTGGVYYIKISAINSSGKTITGWQSAAYEVDLLGEAVGPKIGQPDGADVGNLNWENYQSPPYEEPQQLKIQANFGNSVKGKTVTLYKEGPADVWTAVGTDTANSYGNAYFTYSVTTGEQRLFAEYASDGETEIGSLTGIVTPQSTTGVLNPPTSDGKKWTAHFGDPAVPGKATQLQVQRIPTTETDEVDPTNPEDDTDEWNGPWVTIASGKQDSSGDTTFSVSSPYRVEHNYRAVSGLVTTPEVAFGLEQATPKNSGLSAVYFNTNEGHSVNTRSRYFEGEFSMTADTKGFGCSEVSKITNSKMKGRGNYSWSFRRKSYTLKIDKSTDLCGMGKDKKWALVSGDYDKSLMRNSLAGYIGSKLDNMAWTPHSTPVDLYVNGKYMGNYLLIERVSIDGDRVDIDELKGGEKCEGVKTPDDQATDPNHPNNLDPCKTGGYLLEWDFRKGGDKNVTAGSSGWVGIKDPEYDTDREGDRTSQGISPQQVSYIDSYLGTVDSALKNPGSHKWEDYIDKDSAVDYYIAMEFMKPVDGNMWASVYMYKERDSAAGAKDGKLFFGPLWDFDMGAGSANRAGSVISSSGFYLRDPRAISAQQTAKTWFHRLNDDPSFRSAVRARWNEIKGSIDTDSFLNARKSAISTSASQTFSAYNYSYRISKYQTIKGSWSKDVDYLKSWARNRKSFLSSSSGF